VRLRSELPPFSPSSRGSKIERVPVFLMLGRNCITAMVYRVRAFGIEIQSSSYSQSVPALIQTPGACIGPCRSYS
jgi:hypothetical protein